MHVRFSSLMLKIQAIKGEAKGGVKEFIVGCPESLENRRLNNMTLKKVNLYTKDLFSDKYSIKIYFRFEELILKLKSNLL